MSDSSLQQPQPVSTAVPRIIQGGMGIAVSNWTLARAVSQLGQLGVVSGTAIDSVLVRRLQNGDPGGDVRRAMERFPLPGVAADVLKRFFRPEGTPPDASFTPLPMYQQVVSKARAQIMMLASFVEVHLAKEGHDGLVGLNLLHKIPMPNLHALYGAMLAGVDVVLMGAGIPRDIPGALDALAAAKPASLKLEVEGAAAQTVDLDPNVHWDGKAPEIARPRFFPIISSHLLATLLSRKANGRVDGFVIEGPTAGGHNAPPRDADALNERGEPIYGERDAVDIAKVRDVGLPFYLAGGAGSPEGLRDALAQGAAGIQVGTLFAYCEESGMAAEHKHAVLKQVLSGDIDIYTDKRASPTGYPFKVVRRAEDIAAHDARKRVCDLGYLRMPYVRPDGLLGYRCASEPVSDYAHKGGAVEETEGRRCLCNALMSVIGLPQRRDDGTVEPPLLTSGDDLKQIGRFLKGRERYHASDVIAHLLSEIGPDLVPAQA